jgi:cytochrome P450
MGGRQTSAGPRQATADALLSELGTPEGRQDPYPVYARLRELAPVHLSAGAAYLTRYDDCASVIRNAALGAQSAAWMDTVRPGWRDHAGLRATHESFVFRDPPDHTRLRHLVSGAFTQRKAQDLSRYIARLIDQILDAMTDLGADGGTVDLHEVLATSLPISVIGKIIGVPDSDHPLLREPLEGLRLAVDGSSGAANLPVIDRGAQALISYFADLVAQRRKAPADDLITALVTARDAGPQAAASADDAGHLLGEDELLQTLVLIFSAAIESMVDLLLNGTAALLAFPAQAALLRESPDLGAAAAQEALRYDAPVQAIGRIPARAVTIGGVLIPAGKMILPMLGAANRDPERFAEPDTFDIGRTGATALSFGGGIHHCLGASLGRLEAAMFLPAILRRFRKLRLAGPPVRRGFVLRGFACFPVSIR